MMGDFLKKVTLYQLAEEIAQRLNVRYGKIQLAFHEGRPSEFATVDLRVKMKDSKEEVVEKDL